jgi:hypothetical protein
MNIRMSFLQWLKHIPGIPVCCAFISRSLAVLWRMEIPPLLYSLLVVSLSLYFPLCCFSSWSTLCSLGPDCREITWFYSSIIFCTNHFCGYLIVEPLHSNGCFPDCNRRPVCWRCVFTTVREPVGGGATMVCADWLTLDSMWVAPKVIICGQTYGWCRK